MSPKRPAGYAGPYILPSVESAPGAYVSPTEVAKQRQIDEWPAAFRPNQPAGIEVGEIVAILATGVLDGANAALADSLMVASGSNVSRTTFDDLFEVYNTTFGAGDSITTFGTIDIQNNHSYLLPFPTMTVYHDYRSLIVIDAEAHLGVCYLYGDEIHCRPQMLLL